MSNERALIRAKDMEIEDLKRRLQDTASDQMSEVSVDVVLLFLILKCTQLAESVAAMEARKEKLALQLAKLNGEILTSELPHDTQAPKRRRISDNFMGLGSPKRFAPIDRRAVSTMLKVTEESDMPSKGETVAENVSTWRYGFG